jgi:Haem-binding domain
VHDIYHSEKESLLMFTARRLLYGLIIVIALIQFVPVQRTNPVAPDPVVFADPQAEAIARRSCYDCHSNQTVWPWYANIAPVSWYVVHHVDEGRAAYNFSDVAGMLANPHAHHHPGEDPNAPVTVDTLIDHASDHISEGEMPPAYYTLIHRDAVLSDADKATLIAGIKQALSDHK